MTRGLEAANDATYGSADSLDRGDLPTHQQRVIEEKRELDDRLRRLTAFLGSAASAQLPLVEVRLLSQQHGHMMAYSATLLQRLRLWGVA